MINNNSIFVGVTAYKELIKIIKHAEFKCIEAPNNIACVKRYRTGLPLLRQNKLYLPLNLIKMHIISQF